MATLRVGSGQQYATIAAAVAATQDGDTVLVQAGTYLNDFFTISHKITLQSVGGKAYDIATVAPPNGKAIATVDTDAVIDGFGFSGAAVSDGNGAGIRYEAGNLVVRNSLFWNNQDGILGAANPTGTILVDSSEFSNNGAGDGYTHNLYIGAIAQFTLQNSYVHDANGGHEVKSRAYNNTITNNRIFDNGAASSYDIDLPNGGVDLVQGNVIEKGANAPNHTTIHFGGEGTPYAGSSLSVTGNTIVNDNSGGIAVNNQTGTATVSLSGNQLWGYSAANGGAVAASGNTVPATRPTLDLSTQIPAGSVVPVQSTPVPAGLTYQTWGAAGAVAASGVVLQVGAQSAYRTLAAALAASRDGDTIEVAAGTYVNDFGTVNHKVIIEGVGGIAHFVAQGTAGSALLTINTDVTLENLELAGVHSASNRGAALQINAGNVTVANSLIDNNDTALATVDNAATTVSIFNTEIGPNGNASATTSNLRVGAIGSFTLQNSYVHGAISGHEVAALAYFSDIENSRVIDGTGVGASLSIDLGLGGQSVIKNNVIEKGHDAVNGTMILVGAEGKPYAGSTTTVSGNVLVSDMVNPSHPYTYFVVASNNSGTTPSVSVTGNTFVGGVAGSAQTQNAASVSGSVVAASAVLNTGAPWSAAAAPAGFVAAVPTGGQLLGGGQDYFRHARPDTFWRNGAGNLAVAESGAGGASSVFTAGGQALAIAAGTTVVGAGMDFYGTGGSAVFLRGSDGGLQVDEFDGSGALTKGQAFTGPGGSMPIDTSTTIVGGGGDFFATGGYTAFVRGGGGALMAWEFGATGAINAGQLLLGQGFDAGASVAGSGQDFFGLGGRAVFLRGGDGSLKVDEFGTDGTLMRAQSLTSQGGATLIDTATRIVGGGEDYFGNGGHTAFLGDVGGALQAWGFDASGAGNAGVVLHGETVDTGTTVVGAGGDFFGLGGSAVFMRGAGGALRVDEFDRTGALMRQQALTSGAGATMIDSATTVVGGGEDLFGNGGHTVFLRGGGGAMMAWSFDANGAGNNGAMLATQGFDTATTVIGAGEDFFGTGEHGVFLRAGDGTLSLWDLDSHGQIDARLAFTAGGSALTVASGTQVVGSAGDPFGTGGHAIRLQDASGTSHVWEFSAAGVRTGVM